MDRLVHCAQECNLNSTLDLITECFERCDPLLEHYGKEPDVSLPAWAAVLIATLLVPLSALFSGLTLGLLSLDPMALKIVAQAGTEHERKYATKILPVRERGNLLLCTLLFGNVCVNSAISIVLSDITSGVVGLVLSTVIIVVLGEVVPQAVCSRHALYIGAHSIWVVNIFILLLLPFTWPISKVLDWALGRDIGNVFSQEELKRLIDIHVVDPDAQQTSGLTKQDQKLIIGAMSYKDKCVLDVMTPLEECFMLDSMLRADAQTILGIYKSGFTRIPIYEAVRQSVVGILYAKDLILVNPDDELELSTMLSLRGRQMGRIYQHEKLDKVLQHFMTSASHMLIVHAGPYGDARDAYYNINDAPVVGLLTLEDVLEELIQADIVDETDSIDESGSRSPTSAALRDQRRGRKEPLNHLVTLYESRYNARASALSSQELDAIAAFLTLNVEDAFGKLGRSEGLLHALLRQSQVLNCEESPTGQDAVMVALADTAAVQRTTSAASGTFRRNGSSTALLGSLDPPDPWQQAVDKGLVLYECNKPTLTFTIILQGKVLIRTSKEDFQLELGPWSMLGQGVLDKANSPYVPDFHAVAAAPCRVLRIQRSAYFAALEALRVRNLTAGNTVRNQHGDLPKSNSHPTATGQPWAASAAAPRAASAGASGVAVELSQVYTQEDLPHAHKQEGEQSRTLVQVQAMAAAPDATQQLLSSALAVACAAVGQGEGLRQGGSFKSRSSRNVLDDLADIRLSEGVEEGPTGDDVPLLFDSIMDQR